MLENSEESDNYDDSDIADDPDSEDDEFAEEDTWLDSSSEQSDEDNPEQTSVEMEVVEEVKDTILSEHLRCAYHTLHLVGKTDFKMFVKKRNIILHYETEKKNV